MKFFLIINLLSLVSILHGSDFKLPEDVANSFRLAGHRIQGSDELHGEEKSFVDYVVSNWRDISKNIEYLPPKDGKSPIEIRFNASVVRLGYACDSLPPIEYVEFFEQIVTLYEQKRISTLAFTNLYLGGDIKANFWSVNWEHPRVQGIFDRMRKFDPPLSESFLSLVEAEANGSLADNYMTNVSDDTPPPQTLPGIKLQRPWASAIRKYEALTGKRIPKHPDFPDHNNTRPSRKGLQEGKGLDNSAPSNTTAATPWWNRLSIWIASTTGLIIASIYVIRRRRHLNTTAELR